MNVRKAILNALLAVYGLLWLGGVGSYLFTGGPRPGTEWAAPLFLLVAGLLVMVSARRVEWPLLVAAVGFGLLSEVIGVRFGVPFGAYEYTDVLAPKVLGVPLVIGCAWVVLAAYVGQTVRRLGVGGVTATAIAGAWMTAIDLVIDPLAANGLGYWRWAEAGAYYGIPATNFLGWFAVSALIFAVARRASSRQPPNAWAAWIGLTIVLFFTLIAFATRLFLAGGVGLMLLAIHVGLRYAGQRAALVKQQSLRSCGARAA